MKDTIFIATKRFGTIELHRGADGLYRDDKGGIYGLRDGTLSKDNTDRCGVFPLVIPFKTPLDTGCKVHDYAYESPAYQAFHTEEEADQKMKDLQEIEAKDSRWRHLIPVLQKIVSVFGPEFWENEKTKRK